MTRTGRLALTYALNQNGDLVNINDVPNGNDCNCICPCCHGELCAKNGGDKEKMIPHFAHQSGIECEGAIESALHKMAKDILAEVNCIQLPDRIGAEKGNLLHFDRVEVECYDGETGLRPDCVGFYGNKRLWVEFKNTHAVDEKKKGIIISKKIDCIEIDLHDCALDRNSVKNFLTESSAQRIWICDNSVFSGNKAVCYSGISYCDRSEDNIDFNHTHRSFAKDEKGRLENLRVNFPNMLEHTYYCMACGKELSVEMDKNGELSFIHIENDVSCENELYLQETAKEILFEKFNNSDEFTILIPQYKCCANRFKCPFFNEKGCKTEQKEISYNLKEHGFVECEKDFWFPDSILKCDLVIKRSNTLEDAIVINLDHNLVMTSLKNRIIKLNINNNYSLEEISYNPLREPQSEFYNFKEETKESALQIECNHLLQRFELYSSGKYFIEGVFCTEVDKREHSTAIYQIFFAEEILHEDAIVFSLHKCYQQGCLACYCKLCSYSAVTDWGATICKRYKTKGTPHYPSQEKPLKCPFFRLNHFRISYIEKKYSSLKIVERKQTNGYKGNN